MELKFTFINMNVSESLRKYTSDKFLTQIDKYMNKPGKLLVTFKVEGNDSVVTCAYRGPNRFHFQAEHRCSNMYGSIDHLLAKFIKIAKRHKEKLKSHKGKPHYTGVVLEIEEFQQRRRDAQSSWEDEPIDAGDIVQYEKARRRIS